MYSHIVNLLQNQSIDFVSIYYLIDGLNVIISLQTHEFLRKIFIARTFKISCILMSITLSKKKNRTELHFICTEEDSFSGRKVFR